MSNLAKKTDLEVNPVLNETEKEIVKATIEPKIKDITKRQLAEVLKISIGQAMSVLGNKSLDANDVKIMITALTEEFSSSYLYLTIGELKNAIKRGSFGYYKKEGDVLYLSAANIMNWIKRYKAEKMEVMAKQMDYDKKNSEKELQEQKDKESLEKFYNELPDEMEKADERSFMASRYFHIVYKMGLVNFDKSLFSEIKSQSKTDVENEIKASGVRPSKVKNIETRIKGRAAHKAFFIWRDRTENYKELVKEKIDKRK